MHFQRFDVFTTANDTGRHCQDSWTLLVDHTDGAIHVEYTWSDTTPRHQGMRIVTLADFLRSEITEGLKSRVVDTLKTGRIAANDP